MTCTKFIIAIDPGNNTGITYGYSDQKPITELHDFTPKPATKGNSKKPARKAEEKHIRYGKLFTLLTMISPADNGVIFPVQSPCEIIIICEGAAGFTKGKAAVEVSNKYRGVVEAYAAVKNCTYIGIQPNDLQRWATGKGRAEKTEMLKVASERFGYQGTDDNEGDSVLLYHFAKSTINYEIAPANEPVTTKFMLIQPSKTDFESKDVIEEKFNEVKLLEETEHFDTNWQRLHSRILSEEQ